MPNVKVSRKDCEEGLLPPVCIYCGRQGDETDVRKLAWNPSPLSIPFLSRKVKVRLPACSRHCGVWKKFRRAEFTPWFVLSVLFLVVVVQVIRGAWVGIIPGLEYAFYASIAVCTFAFLIIRARNPVVLAVPEISDRFIVFADVPPPFEFAIREDQARRGPQSRAELGFGDMRDDFDEAVEVSASNELTAFQADLRYTVVLAPKQYHNRPLPPVCLQCGRDTLDVKTGDVPSPSQVNTMVAIALACPLLVHVVEAFFKCRQVAIPLCETHHDAANRRILKRVLVFLVVAGVGWLSAIYALASDFPKWFVLALWPGGLFLSVFILRWFVPGQTTIAQGKWESLQLTNVHARFAEAVAKDAIALDAKRDWWGELDGLPTEAVDRPKM